MKIIHFFFFLYCLSVTVALSAQTQQAVLPAKSVVVYMEVIDNGQDFSLDALLNDDNLLDNQQFNAKVTVILFDEVDISKIHVKLGTTPGADDLAAQSFNFDGSSALLPELSFEHQGRNLTFGMGEFGNLETYHAEVVIEDIHGTLSEPRYFSSN